MSAIKDVTRGLAPYLLLAGVVGLAWVYRGKIADWFKSSVTGPILDWGYSHGGTRPEDMDKPIFGACSTGIAYMLNWNNCRNAGQGGVTDGGTFYPSPNPTPTPGNLMDDIALAYHCSQVPSDPRCPQGGQGLLIEPPAPVSNLVVGTAAEAAANAERIRAEAEAALRAEHPFGLISSYNQVRQYDTNRLLTPHGQPADFYDPATGRYLDISPYGWVVYGLSTAYLGDPPSGKWHNLYGQGGSFGGLTHELGAWV